ncbi:MAG TPA: N,N-dimethylformamidase beta subunit family domain-containing protein [Solirubrobacterales bacterium]|jgi:N,N-dimethylformamidase|nr:N,N-dimethylformamidase beta subunit family domain-containing protein [Solirubrobacterales bacterium]
MPLSGYSDLWSVEPGEEIKFMVSTEGDEVETQLVRLLHGHEHADGPGFQERELEAEVNGSVAAVRQRTAAGSFVALGADDGMRGADPVRLSLFVWPTLRADAPQTIASMLAGNGDGWLLQMVAGHLRLSCRRAGATETLEGPALELRQWAAVDALVAAGDGRLGLSVAAGRGAGNESSFAEQRQVAAGQLEPGAPFLLGGRPRDDGSDRLVAVECFNGKVDSPVLRLGAEAAGEPPPAPWHSGLPAPSRAAFAWDLAQEPDGARAVDVSGNGRHGRVVNAPARLMTGPHWDRTTTSPAAAPEQWSAIHLHEDDLDDAGWTPTTSWTVPDGTPSAVYALRVRSGSEEDHLPFTVRPKAAGPRADVALVLPTFTYMAYANERLIDGSAMDGLLDETTQFPVDRGDELLRSRPEWGLSLYDRHRDGSGSCYSSRLRPIPSVRPRYLWWATGAPERFAADLYLVHFLDRIGQEVDVLTDEDLHRDGLSCLGPYKVVLTGTHPEYTSLEMLEAIEDYLRGGGKMMYLGGNGFYWVTSVDRERPHLIEVRRGHQGTRPWTSEPGEVHHSSSGEQGSLWRFRGRDPNRLVGVAFSAQSGGSSERAPGYRRLPDSRDPRAAFVFEGVGEDELIGDFGLINDGAAGYEIDRTDAALGAPVDLLRLATSEGMHGPAYTKVVEDVEFVHLDLTGPTCDDVRADMTLLPYPNGGAVFSVGSCNWCGALSHENYENNVARITENVLAGFLAS